MTMYNLEKFIMSDFEQLQSWVPDKEFLLQFAGPKLQFPLTREQFEYLLSSRDWLVFKLVDDTTGQVVGHGEINIAECPNVKLGRLLIGEPNMRGAGLGEQLVRRLLEYAFIMLGAEQAELNVFDFNVSAIRCYTKCGFKINPAEVKTTQLNHKTWTLLNMQVSKAEWTAINAT